MEEVRKRSTNEDSNLIVFQKIEQGKRPSEICKELNLSKSTLQYTIDKLKNGGFIAKKGYGVWEVRKKYESTSLGTTKPITNLHALQISFPILEGTINDSDWQVKEKLNNWLPKYASLNSLGGLTVKNNNNKSLTVWAKSRNITNTSEIDNLAYQIRDYIYLFFKTKHGVELDKYNVECKNLDIATEDKPAQEMRGKGEKFVLEFDKTAEKIFPKDKLRSKAMIDGSPFAFSAETNDKEWKRYYLQMPFNIKSLMSSVMYIAKNYESHVRIVEQASKVIAKLDKALSTNSSLKHSIDKKQTKLFDFERR